MPNSLDTSASSSIGIYIHWPWCKQKCPYCDFNSHATSPQEEAYLETLLQEIEQQASQYGTRAVHSVFFGGGTPSLLSGEAVQQIISRLGESFQLKANAEVSLEANPGAIDERHFEQYLKAGVNRLSIGAQSFDDQALALLGRIHQHGDTISAIQTARSAGFSNINIDIIYGLSHQTPAMAMADLEQAIALNTEHLSWYHLTLEPNTVFYKKPPPNLPNTDTVAEIEAQGLEVLSLAGFEQYEISAYAKPGHRCEHNLGYWRYDDFLGLGPGAHGKLTINQEVLRTENKKMPTSYLKQSFNAYHRGKNISQKDRLFEFLLNQTRLIGPVTFRHTELKTSLSREQFLQNLEHARHQGFIQHDRDVWWLTSFGRQYVNDFLQLAL